ncbi:type III pantothenate kinase [Hypericibacter adhaerens]|jgi:type III pantothenate kinase|uniref:Type III pantothenate kinase n=1 Tax=Hypericibacter adhaerens TaxID=2602016 RepID=A0A5J6MZ44_9PROT|nr:type III pantothenate kinase [Hypericibacter adhaerens]QEX22354.1 type III pantothenate kinase [Hypericibacter adhaerens]
MLLAVNANNTNVKFAVYDGDRLRGDWRLHTSPARTADEYLVWLDQLMGHAGLRTKDIDGTVIATVVPPTLFNLRQLCDKYFRTDPVVVGDPGIDLGIKVLMDRPEEVGADRLANAVGGHLLVPDESLIVVDFGTATTFDVIAESGDYCGGVIAPGINLSLEALHGATAKLPRIAVEKPPRVIGKNTLGAMQAGVYWGYISLIEGVVARIREEWGKPMRVIATGGLAPLFHGNTPTIERLEPEITMRGLVEIYRRNNGRGNAGRR